MDDASIKALAGEPPEIPRKRERLEGEKTRLEKGLERCQTYRWQSQRR